MENNWVFQPLQMPVSVLIFIGVIMVVTAWVSYSNWNRRRGTGVAMLELLRFIIMGMILFTLCKPEFLRITSIEEQPEVVILKDVSGSMTTKDVRLGARNVVTREKWLMDQLTTNVWEEIEKKAKVTVQDFGMSGTDDPDHIKAGTDIFNALESQRAKNKNLKAIFLISDGDSNYGKDPQKAAMKLAASR